MKAVILAGGLGTRLQPYTTFMPKPMLPLGEKPLLEHLIEWNKKNGIRSVVLCVSYLRKTIQDYFEDGGNFGVKIEYAVSKKPLATAGQLKTAEEFLTKDSFVCMYGDSIFDFSLRNMIKQHRNRGSFVTMSLYEYRTNIQYGVIETSGTGRVTGWNEKPEIKARVNMGCYVMDPRVLSYIPAGRPYGMDSVIKKAVSQKRAVDSYVTKRGFIDIGDKASYRKAYQVFYQRLGKI